MKNNNDLGFWSSSKSTIISFLTIITTAALVAAVATLSVLLVRCKGSPNCPSLVQFQDCRGDGFEPAAVKVDDGEGRIVEKYLKFKLFTEKDNNNTLFNLEGKDIGLR